ncbi:MAG: phosphoadenosine phosphosulfate reductase family protein, partial [Pseudomonadota bacterium]
MLTLPEGANAQLRDRVGTSRALLAEAIAHRRFGNIAVVSSFGAEAAVLLHLASLIDQATPVVFIDTRMLFQETLDYKATLIRTLGLTDVRTVSPAGQIIRQRDPWGRMHLTNPDACCGFRKADVLAAALAPFDAWITGRKRFQAVTRSGLSTVETQGNGKTKL